MKNYDNSDNFRERTHTVEITLQTGEYTGKLIGLAGGRSQGLQVLEMFTDIGTLWDDIVEGSVKGDCIQVLSCDPDWEKEDGENYSEDDKYINYILTSPDSGTLSGACMYVNDLARLIVKLEILECEFE